MGIRMKATVQEARTASKHNLEQWDQFYLITKDEAKQISEAHPEWKGWILVPVNERERMLERVNTRLLAEGIPPVDMKILKWRASQLLRDIQRKYEVGSMLQGMSGANSESRSTMQIQTAQSPLESGIHLLSPPRSRYSPDESRPYDPIRDA